MLLEVQYHSKMLNIDMGINVVLPDRELHKTPFPVVYLLHGYSDNYTAWARKSCIERYACERGIAVVMPEGFKAYYSDALEGIPYFQFLSHELIEWAEGYFPVSKQREDRYAAGLSMGGYGAFKLALRHPELFRGAASLSGALDIVAVAAEFMEEEEMRRKERSTIFGDAASIEGSVEDLFYWAEQPQAKQVQLFQSCGTEDFLYQGNIRFREHARRFGLNLTYHEEPGDHTWDYWDRNIQRALDWMMQARA